GLADQLFGAGNMRLVVVRDGIDPAAHLPGGVILLSRRLVEQPDGPEVAAGFALAEALRAERADPMVPVLDHAGLFATLRLLTSGALPQGALAGYAERLARTPPAPLPTQVLLTRMAAAGVPAAPYAYALDAPEEVALPLIEGDPRRGLPPVPLMPDAAWVAMQAVCTE
ncbi:MAG: hypothetical protein IE927_16790, partial [Rhodobacterales bacterium]|nr:hypothetical protein [Rhodobacterales bacterium]